MTAFLTDPPTAAMLLLLLALGVIGAWRAAVALARWWRRR